MPPSDTEANSQETAPALNVTPGREGEARSFCRTMLREDPTLLFGEVRRAARARGLEVSAEIFGAVHGELGEPGGEPAAGPVAREPEPVPAPAPVPAGESPPAPAARARRRPGPAPERGSAAMDFLVGHLRSHPDATYQEVKAAAARAGVEVFPITFGNARRLAGIGKHAPRTSQPASKTPAPGAASAPARLGSRGAEGIVHDLAAMLEDLERKRQELRETLAAIGRLAREGLNRTS